MENNEQFLKFRNIELVSYINTKHTKVDLVQIEAERNTVKGLLKRANDELFQYFLRKQDEILHLLETHKETDRIITGFQKKGIIKKETTVETYSAELKKKLKLFEDEMDIFLTAERCFIASLELENILLILTNDLLFIGEKNGKKYKLKRTVNRELAGLEVNENKLKIQLDGEIKEYEGEKTAVERFYEGFQEISYEFMKDEGETKLDYDLIEYYIETRKYGALVGYLENNNSNDDRRIDELLNKVEVYDEFTLFAHGKIKGNLVEFFKGFFYNRFKQGFENINKLQPLSEYVKAVFEFVGAFAREFKKYSERDGVTRRAYVLVLEDCVRFVVESLESRGGAVEARTMIKDKLEFEGLNFRYVLEEVEVERPVGAERLEEAKGEIKRLLRELLLQ